MKKSIVLLITCFILLTVLAADTATKYAIGDKGLGGGLIFYIEGNTYFECSKLLGEANWANATIVAKDYRGGGYDDWYLPNRTELNYIYENLRVQGYIADDEFYWTSSKGTTDLPWIQSFSNGAQGYYHESYTFSIRAVRTFSVHALGSPIQNHPHPH